ncbi:hypothetical protein ACL00X_11230 [Aeromonas diversa]|uniref:hypothetical protein n=1 Tax=Aeromonas diversa TaxID=502790 RepID=UPI00399F3C70
MSNKHEREPWVLGGCSGRMVTTPGGYVGDGFIADVDTKDTARRIVACVNACEGMSNDELEGGLLLGVMGKRIATLEQQRDELLAALEDIRALDWRSRLRGLDRPTDFAEREAAVSTVGEAATIARQAIAKAKGGAA